MMNVFFSNEQKNTGKKYFDMLANTQAIEAEQSEMGSTKYNAQNVCYLVTCNSSKLKSIVTDVK